MALGCSANTRVGLVLDDGAGLHAEVLLEVVRATARLAGGPRSLPAAEGLHARPRTGRRSGGSVDVDHAGLDAGEEPLDLRLLVAEQAGGQPERHGVGPLQRFVERGDRTDGENRDEQLVGPHR